MTRPVCIIASCMAGESSPGLTVSLDQGVVVVAPGLALDCAGNELILPTEERVSLSGLTGRQYVTIRYVELPTATDPITKR